MLISKTPFYKSIKTLRKTSIITYMKKISLLLSLAILTLSSCESNSSPYYGKNTLARFESLNHFIDLTPLQLENKIENSRIHPENDFLVFVYQTTCSACDRLESYINDILKDDPIAIYGINYSQYIYLNQQNSALFPPVSYTPFFLFYSDGEVTAEAIPPSRFSSQDKFTNALYELFDSSKLTYLNDVDNESEYSSINYSTYSNLLKKIKSEDNLIVLYTLDTCLDCASLFSDFFLDFAKSLEKTIYLFETKDIVNNEETYQQFIQDTGLNHYRNGVYPSFVKYKDGKFDKLITYLNYQDPQLNDQDQFFYPNAYNPEVKELTENSADELFNLAKEIDISIIKDLYLSK